MHSCLEMGVCIRNCGMVSPLTPLHVDFAKAHADWVLAQETALSDGVDLDRDVASERKDS